MPDRLFWVVNITDVVGLVLLGVALLGVGVYACYCGIVTVIDRRPWKRPKRAKK